MESRCEKRKHGSFLEQSKNILWNATEVCESKDSFLNNEVRKAADEGGKPHIRELLCQKKSMREINSAIYMEGKYLQNVVKEN